MVTNPDMMRRFFPSTISNDNIIVDFTTATEINGLKLRIPTYTGPLARIERLSDNTTLDIFPDGSGYADETEIADFCSGTTGRYRIIYGQKEFNDLSQTTFSQMPYCYRDGAVTKLDGIVALDFGNTENLAMQYGTALESINVDGFFFLNVSLKDDTNTTAQQMLSHTTANRQFRYSAGAGEILSLIGAGVNLSGVSPSGVTSKVKGFKTINLNVDSVVFLGEVDGNATASVSGAPTTYEFNQIGRRATASEVFSGKMIESMYWDAFTITLPNENEIRQQLVDEYDS